jgi:branched-chain amino acid transport system permease protein
MSVAAKILVFILLVASYDLLLGYTGIVSFAHTMFFGIGAYGVAIASTRWARAGRRWPWARRRRWCLGAAVAGDRPVLAAREGDLLRDDHAGGGQAFQTLASQLSDFTGGEDGLTFKNPEVAEPVVRALRRTGAGPAIDGKASPTTCCSWWCAAVPALLRIVNSPFGRVLQAIRENDFRAEAIGYRTVVYRTWSNVLSALFATAAGALLALWLRYVGPDTTLSFEIMLDILLIVVIGGMGTMYGAVIGSGAVRAGAELPAGPAALGAGRWRACRCWRRVTPDRWLLWLGVLFVLSVYHFPTGIVGRLRARGQALKRRRLRKAAPCQRNRSTCPAKAARSTSPNGAPGRPPALIAWHGLARTGRDMDAIAAHLAQRWRVICPDTLGRGLSQWSPAPGRRILPGLLRAAGRLAGRPAGHAQMPLAGHLDGRRHRPACGGRPLRGRIQRLVLNDIGPQLAGRGRAHPQLRRQPAGLCHDGRAGGLLPHRLQALRLAQRRAVAALTETSMRRLPDGRVTPHYDPAMVQQFIHHPADYDQWDSLPGCCACAATATCCCLAEAAHARPARRGAPAAARRR